MSEGLRFTVVTPSYEQAGTLTRCMDSVMNQDYPHVEYFVLDGGSTDGSRELIAERAGDIDWWYSEPDGGQTAALRRGFERATGDVLCWVNSDDFLIGGALQEVARRFSEDPGLGFIYGDAEVYDGDGVLQFVKRETSFDWFTWLWWYNYVPQPSAFWKRDLYERAGGLDVEFSLAMDADLWERMGQLCTPVHFSRVWSGLSVYPEQKNRAFREQSDREDWAIRCRHLGREPGPFEHAIRRGSALCKRSLKRLGVALTQGRRRQRAQRGRVQE